MHTRHCAVGTVGMKLAWFQTSTPGCSFPRESRAVRGCYLVGSGCFSNNKKRGKGEYETFLGVLVPLTRFPVNAVHESFKFRGKLARHHLKHVVRCYATLDHRQHSTPHSMPTNIRDNHALRVTVWKLHGHTIQSRHQIHQMERQGYLVACIFSQASPALHPQAPSVHSSHGTQRRQPDPFHDAP